MDKTRLVLVYWLTAAVYADALQGALLEMVASNKTTKSVWPCWNGFQVKPERKKKKVFCSDGACNM
jgi:hypothetical protein